LEAYVASPSRTAVDLATGSARRLRALDTSLDLGDLDCTGQICAADITHITQATTSIVAAGGLPVLLGGDHRVFEGLVAGVSDTGGGPAILSISNNLTLPTTVDGEPLPLANMATDSEGSRPLLCAGVNGLQSGEAWLALKQISGHIVTADELHDTPHRAHESINRFVGEQQSLVCCIDLEVLDSGHAAGTPGVNVGGITPEQLSELLAAIDFAKSLSGIAITNVAPKLDARGLTELAAAEALFSSLRGFLFDDVAQ
jgi:agmatinase